MTQIPLKMSEDSSTIAREAKTIHQTLKELLKAKEPFDKEVEFQRKTLRKRYLTLLLLHPYAKESKDVETHLWMQTSYAFISSYKHRITLIDRAIQANARQSEHSKQQAPKQNTHGPVEYRKLLQRFRQFLAEEEKFWIQLVLRMHRSFEVKDADYALAALGLTTEANSIPAGETNTVPHTVFPQQPPGTFAPSTQAEKDSRLTIMSKALICLGDIARYRELYNESGGRPRAGHEAGTPARRGKVRKRGPAGIEAAPMLRNYDRAQHRYEQAQLLVPYEGNASHQLAIVASYLPDALVSLAHYYRSLCVKHPYEPAAENMAIHMTKTFQSWNRTKQERERILSSPPVSIQNQVDIFKNRVVVLHALWRKNADRDIREQERRVYEDFHRLVGNRDLSGDTISNVVVLSEGALWKHRMIRDTNSARTKHEVTRSPEANIVLEWRIFRHLLDIHIALLEVGKQELKEAPSMEKVDNDLAQRITATFRRTLPALRIASKWLKANINYVMQDPEFKAHQQKERSKGGEPSQKAQGKISGHSGHTIRFWNRYSQFVTSLAHAFPEKDLVPLSHPLEEDIDMRGFLPLKKAMGEGVSVKDRTAEAHPNEEQLMRISELLSDAKDIAALENSPLAFEDGGYRLNESVLESRSNQIQNAHLKVEKEPPTEEAEQAMMEEIRDSKIEAEALEDDAMTEATSRTDDDIVNDAFKFVGLGGMEEEDDEDEIVWNPKATSPTLSPLVQATPMTPVKSFGPIGGFGSPPHQTLSPKLHASMKTPMGSPRAPAISALTAQDLLQGVMNVGRKPNPGLVSSLDSPVTKPALLFGSDLAHQPITHSIWAASQDEKLHKFGGVSSTNQLGIQTSPRHYPSALNSPQDLSPNRNNNNATSSAWSSQTMSSISSNAPFYVPGSIQQQSHSLPNGQSSTTLGNSHHYRTPSSSNIPGANTNMSHLYGGQNFRDPAIQSFSPMAPQQQQQQYQSQHQRLPSQLPPQLGSSLRNLSPQALLFHQQQLQQGANSNLNNQGFYDAISSAQGRYTIQHSGSLGHDSRAAPQSFGHITSPLSAAQLWGKIG